MNPKHALIPAAGLLLLQAGLLYAGPSSAPAVNRTGQQLTARIEQLRAAGKTPVAVFDLDSTLFNNGPRTCRILLEAALGKPSLSAYAPNIRSLPANLPYTINDILIHAGITNAVAMRTFRTAWAPKFFSGHYCRYDLPANGAVECVRHLHRSGVTIVYLTGRKADSMGAATVQSLSSFGFPVLTDTAILMMKPDSNETDVDYKARCFKAIARLGTVMLTADNEPENVNRFIKEWPDAVNLLLETNCNPDRQVPLRDQAVRMPDFIGLADTPPFTDR